MRWNCFAAAPPLDTVYVPIGLGSGICGVIAMRDALGPSTKVVGVVSTEAPAYALSFAAGKVVATNSADTMADGMAVRGPDAEALAVILKGADRIVQVSDAEIAVAMRAYYEDTHQLTEGAGAASLAALLQERERLAGKRVGLVLSGGNIDRPVYLRLLADAEVPEASGAQARSLFTACMMKDERVPRTPGMRSSAFRAKSLKLARSGASTWSRKSMSPVTA